MTKLDLAIEWETTKNAIAGGLQLSHGMLHIHVGLLLYVVFVLVLRRPAGSLLPLLGVVVLEIGNEALDFARYYLSHWPWTAMPTVQDLIGTLWWPVILTAVDRFRHRPRKRPQPAVVATV